MTATWLCHKLGSDATINQLILSIKEAGRDVDFVDLKEAFDQTDVVNEEKKCVVVTGSIYFNSRWRKARPNWIGNWHSRETMLCSHYYSYWGEHLVQRNYTFLPLGEVLRRKDHLYTDFALGTGELNGHIFIRPDSGEKEFTGELVHRDRFDGWRETIGRYTSVLPHDLCVVSEPVPIKKEVRLIIADKKVVTGSTYRIEGHLLNDPLEELDDRNKIIEFTEMVLNNNPPPLPPVHVLDLAYVQTDCDYMGDPGWRIMEVGCFCCAGLYASDRRKIAPAVSAAAERAFEEAMKNPADTGSAGRKNPCEPH